MKQLGERRGEYGSGRVFMAWILVFPMFLFTLVGSAVAQSGEAASAYSPVTVSEARQAVLDELRARGLQEEQMPRVEDMELPDAVPARIGRTLRVSSLCSVAGDGWARVTLRCDEGGACLPFFVYVRRHESWRAAACDLVRLPNPQSSYRPVAVPAPVVRAGDRATAVLITAGLRITAAVTCLDRGARGEVIRVRGAEGSVFRARVSGPALVEALPQ